MDLQTASHLPPLASQIHENRERIRVLLTHVIHPGYFFVRIISVPPALRANYNLPAIDFEELSFELKRHYRNSPPISEIERVPGYICVVQLKSGEFRRCKILNQYQQVRLVDVGVTLSEVASSQLRHLDDKWSLDHLPAMAFCCSLWGLRPRCDVRIWSKASSERLMKLMTEAGAQFMRVYNVIGKSVLKIRLYYEFVQPDYKILTGCVNDELVEQGLVRIAHSSCPVSVGMPTEWPPCLSLPPYLEAKPTWIDENGEVLYIHHIQGPHHQLERIDSLLNWYYRESRPDLEELTHWEVGQPCVAKCVVDEKWYRGRTVTVDNVKKLATIRFVDYGNEAYVLYKDMRRILICLDYPIQAYKVRLANHPCEYPPTITELRMLDNALINQVIRMRIEYDGSSEIPLAKDVQFATGSADLNAIFNLLRLRARPFIPVSGVALPTLPINHPLVDELGSPSTGESVPASHQQSAGSLPSNGFDGFDVGKSSASAPEMSAGEATGIPSVLKKRVTLFNGQIREIVSERGTQLDEAEVVIPVKFHSIASPEEIYVRTLEQAATHHYLSAAMPEYYKKNPVEKRKINFDIGYKCAVCIDDTWYRAEVVDMENYPQVEVYLSDMAESHKVQESDIRRLPEDLTAFPQTVMRVGLFGVFPTSGTKWEPIVTNFIMDRLRGEKLITIGGRSHPTGTQPLQVLLVYVYDEEGGPLAESGLTSINLNEELIERRYALRTPIVGMVRRPARRTNWITKEQPRMGDFFHAHVYGLNTKGEIFVQDVRNGTELERITTYLTEKYKNTKSTQDDRRCSVGDLCITTYKNDGYWYRAVVRGFLKNGEVEVFYADYGNLDKVAKEDIRLNIDLEDDPVQTVRCAFHNLSPTGDGANGWDSRINDEIQNFAVDQIFKVKVKAVGPPIQVNLKNNGRNFNKHLVDKNLAEFVYIPPPIEPSKRLNKIKKRGLKKTMSAESH